MSGEEGAIMRGVVRSKTGRHYLIAEARHALALLWCAGMLALSLAVLSPARAGEPGLVVDAVSAVQTQIQIGDRLLHYDGKPLTSTYALQAAIEHAGAKTNIPLEVQRTTRNLSLTISPGALGVSARPDLPPAVLELHQATLSAFLQGRAEEALALHQSALRAAREAGEENAWLWLQISLAEEFYSRGRVPESRAAWLAAEQVLRDEKQGDDAMRAYCYASLGLMGRAAQPPEPETRAWFEKAIAVTHRAGYEIWEANYRNQLAELSAQAGDWKTAGEELALARPVLERLAPQSPMYGNVLVNSGDWARHQNDLETAAAFYERARALWEKLLLPLPAALAAERLGDVALARRDFAQAKRLFELALAAYRFQQPFNEASVESKLGHMAAIAEQWDEALTHLNRVVEIHRALPGAPPLLLAAALSDLAELELTRFDLDNAEAHYQESLALLRQQQQGPESQIAEVLTGLGAVARFRMNYDEAAQRYRDAQKVLEKIAPDSPAVADALLRQARIRLLGFGRSGDKQQRRAEAAALARRALAIYEQQQEKEKTSEVALEIAEALAVVAEALPYDAAGRAEAQRLRLRALAIRERESPREPDTAALLLEIAKRCEIEDDFAAEREYLERARAILAGHEPSLDYVRALRGLGFRSGAENDWLKARDYYRVAAEAMDAVRRQEALPEGRVQIQEFMASSDPYRALLAAQIHLKEYGAAFETVERLRARTLSEMLSERRLDVWATATPVQVQERDAKRAERDAAYTRLGGLDPVREAARMRDVQNQIQRLNRELFQLERAVREASTPLASLPAPAPLTFEQARAALDPGTLLLSYVTDDTGDETIVHLFAVTRAMPLEYRELHFGSRELQAPLNAFNYAAQTRGEMKLLLRNGRWIYDRLLRPVQSKIKEAKRLLICADGDLLTVPFAALPVEIPEAVAQTLGEPDEDDEEILEEAATSGQSEGRTIGLAPLARPGTSDYSGVRFLAEDKPLHTISSLSVYVALKSSAVKSSAPPVLLALGAPLYEGGAQTAFGQAKADLKTRGYRLSPLPNTKFEVEQISELYSAKPHLAREATKSTVFNEAANADVLHFACHGLLNESNPLASALALTPEDETQDGMLRGYEVIERLHLKARLVVLSACQTGLGEESSSEGVIGLTRAFQIAGAQNIVASLWSVADKSTAQLMIEFQRRYRDGQPADEALQQAQITFLRDQKSQVYRHPYYWAPFFVTGHPQFGGGE